MEVGHTIFRTLAWSISILSAVSAFAQTSPALRSPWDLHAVTVTDLAYSRSVPQPLPKDITANSYYSDPKHSVVDQARYDAYNAAEKPFRDTMQAAETAADKFQATGSRAAADYLLRILTQDAQAAAMTGKMSSNQAYYVQNWTLSALAITWLKVRQANPGSREDRQAVADWLKQVAGSVMGYFDRGRAKGSGDSQNNHYAWAGLSVMAAGVAADDRTLFDWGVAAYDDGVSRIQPDGTLPLEMARGRRALHYHLFALAPLVTIAEFGAANGLDLYKRNDGALARLVDRSVSGLEDNRYFAEKSGVAQDTPAEGGVKGSGVTFLTPYQHRFPNPALTRLLQTISPKPNLYLGGLPPP